MKVSQVASGLKRLIKNDYKTDGGVTKSAKADNTEAKLNFQLIGNYHWSMRDIDETTEKQPCIRGGGQR